MPDLVTCSHCGRRLRLPDRTLGRKVRCPACAMVFRAGGRRPVTADTAVQPCPEPVDPDLPDPGMCSHCGCHLRLPDRILGRKVRCPACGKVYRAGGRRPVTADTVVQPFPEPVNPHLSAAREEASIAARPLPPAEPAPRLLTGQPAQEEQVVLSEAGARSGVRRARHRRPVFLFVLALLPLGIPAVTFLGVFIANMSVLFAGVLGAGLGLCLAALGVGLALLDWPVVPRALLSVGLTGVGYLAAGAALVVCLMLNAPIFEASAWKECKPEGGGFRVLMPGTPEAQTRMLPTPTGAMAFQEFMLEVTHKDFLCSVGYFDLSSADLLVIPIERRFQASLDEVIYKLPSSRLHAEREITLDGHRGQEFEIVAPGNGYYLQRMYVVGKGDRWRLYLLAVAGRRIRPGCEDAQKFFDSFALGILPARPPTPSPAGDAGRPKGGN